VRLELDRLNVRGCRGRGHDTKRVCGAPFVLNLPYTAAHGASPSASCLLSVGNAFAAHGTCTLSTAILAHMHACSGHQSTAQSPTRHTWYPRLCQLVAGRNFTHSSTALPHSRARLCVHPLTPLPKSITNEFNSVDQLDSLAHCGDRHHRHTTVTVRHLPADHSPLTTHHSPLTTHHSPPPP
jgi:hypothetical protein